MDRKSDSPGSVLKKLFTEPALYSNPVKEKDYSPNKKQISGNPPRATKAAGFNVEQYVKDNFTKPVMDKAADVQEKKIYTTSEKKEPALELQVSQKQLQEAIIWSEILGKPACKRHRKWRL